MREFRNLANGILLAALSAFVSLNAAEAGHEKVLYNFTGGGDGNDPDSRLVMDADGNLYGTTFDGGDFDAGTVFKVRPNGVQTVLYSFTGGKDGGFPTGDLILETDNGGLVGTTEAGGDHNVGTIFTVDRNGGGETVDYSFTGGSDGANPVGGLIEDGSFNLYGTTKNDGDAGFGTVFELVAFGGGMKLLHTFAAGGDGANPEGSLVLDADGNLYGTTLGGGALNQGTVFKFTPHGKLKVLHSFDGNNDGRFPSGGLVAIATAIFMARMWAEARILPARSTLNRRASSKCLMPSPAAATAAIPLAAGSGWCWRYLWRDLRRRRRRRKRRYRLQLSAGGKEKVLHSFDADIDVTDGLKPSGGLTMDAGGTLYGVTAEGGNSNAGTVFRVNN